MAIVRLRKNILDNLCKPTTKVSLKWVIGLGGNIKFRAVKMYFDLSSITQGFIEWIAQLVIGLCHHNACNSKLTAESTMS